MSEDGDRPRARPLDGTVLGRYRLIKWLGEGGMGAVYEACHEDLGKRVAIKTLHERFAAAPDARQRFLREGRAAAQIRHLNVVDVYDVAIDGIYPYLVMEFLDGEDLSRLLSRRGALSVPECADLIVPVVAAVAAAHDLGIVHRDLKPENIFLAQTRAGATPKVLDFGISKFADSDGLSALTGTGALLGTPHYMSPEQARGEKQIDPRSDQYSLGVVLYQCATGRRPLQGVPLYALIQKTVHGDFPPPRQLTPALPSAFEELILRAMARDPERRFPMTRMLGQALLGFASERVRSAYEAELGGKPFPAPALAYRAEVAASELSTTLGESAHVRAVAPIKPSLRRRVGAVSALVLAAGLFSWRLAEQRAPRALSLAAGTAALTGEPPANTAAVLPLSAASGAPAPAVPLANSSSRADAPSAPADVPSPPSSFGGTEAPRKTTAAETTEALARGARDQTLVWRGTRKPADCRQARELWLAYRALDSDPAHLATARAALSELGECGGGSAAARSDRSPAQPAPAAPKPSEPNLSSPPVPRPASPPVPLPSDDPEDGFVDVGRR